MRPDVRLKPLLLAALFPVAVHAQDSPAQAPTTVVITAPKADIVKKIDKTVYNPVNSPKSANGTVQDVLQSAPGVSVTAEGALSVRGNDHVTVLIDGKPSAEMSGENRAVALQTMAASDIASIEVITNPSAAYSANGGAIINIVLKADRKPGAHVSLRGSASDQGLWTTNATADYTRGKLSLRATAGLRHDASLKFRDSDLDWHDPVSGGSGEIITSSRVFIRRVTANAALGADYDLDEAGRLSAEANWHFRHSRPLFDELHQDYAAGRLGDIYHHISDGPNQQSDDSVSVSYSREAHDAALKAGLQHSDTFTLVDKSFIDIAVFPVTPDSHARIAGKTLHRLDEATLDYTRPLGGDLRLGLGFDLRHDVDGVGNHFAYLDPLAGAAAVDPQAANRYRATTTQAAVYITGQVTWNAHWEALAGLRLESLRMRLDSDGLAAIDGPRYGTFDPSLHLKYAADAERSVTLSYRQSLERPDAGDLDPHITYVDAQNRSSGNPDLKPQALKSLEVSFDDDRKALSRGFGLFYRRSSDTVVDSRLFAAGNVLLTSKQNGGDGLSLGATGSVEWRPRQGLKLTADASLYQVRLETPDLDGPLRQAAVSYQVNFAIDYRRGADDFAFDGHVQGPGIIPERRQSAGNTLNVSWQRTLGKRLSLTLNANDVLDGSKQSFVMRTATFDQRGFNHFVVRRIYLGLVYRLG